MNSLVESISLRHLSKILFKKFSDFESFSRSINFSTFIISKNFINIFYK